MRAIGFALLIAGFGWICWNAWSMRPIANAVVADHSNQLPQAGRTWFKPEDVQDRMQKVVSDTLNHLPTILIPAGMMLVGGIVLGFSRKSTNKQK